MGRSRIRKEYYEIFKMDMAMQTESRRKKGRSRLRWLEEISCDAKARDIRHWRKVERVSRGDQDSAICRTSDDNDDQGPDFDDMSSFFPCEIDDAIQYVNLG
jgi:hypothetical protein